MRITNEYGLPDGLVQAIANDPYDRGESDISVTQLIGPPQIRVLTEQHADEIVEDASERVWSLLGQAVHTILERAEPTALAEQRLFADFDGWKLSGQFDRLSLKDGLLQDYKVTSAWAVVYADKPEWEEQLNVLAELAEINGHEIKSLEIVGIFRDWSASKAEQDDKYPQVMVERIPIDLWPRDKRTAFIRERIALHKAASDGDIPPCTDEERWLRGEAWAVMKAGRKSALRVLPTEQDALFWAEANQLAYHNGDHWVLTNGINIEHRPGRYMRCEKYCPVRNFCAQWAADQGGYS